MLKCRDTPYDGEILNRTAKGRIDGLLPEIAPDKASAFFTGAQNGIDWTFRLDSVLDEVLGHSPRRLDTESHRRNQRVSPHNRHAASRLWRRSEQIIFLKRLIIKRSA